MCSLLHFCWSFSIASIPVSLRRYNQPKKFVPLCYRTKACSPRRYDSYMTIMSELNPSLEKNYHQNPFEFVKTVWDFSRPHTVIGSFLSIVSLFAFATPRALWFSKKFLYATLYSLLPSILVNIYITGLNQVTDVDIDKINKPYLPIASGKLSLTSGIAIVIGTLFTSLVISWHAAWPLKMALYGSTVLGTLYSLPPFRLKRFPMLAALCILVVRGSIINLGFFFQAKMSVMQQHIPSLLSGVQTCPESLVVTSFFAIFGLVIAIMKDVPDVKGDLKFNIRSFSVRVGAKRMFEVAWRTLLALLSSSALGIFLSLFLPFFSSVSPSVSSTNLLLQPTVSSSSSTSICSICSYISSLISLHSCSVWISRLFSFVMLSVFAWDVQDRAKKIEVEDTSSVFDFYMYIWKIFYACYLLLPLATL